MNDLSNFISFINGNLCVKVTNKEEYESFVDALKYHRVEGLLRKQKEYKDWVKLARINFRKTDLFLFEVNNGELTWGDDEKEAEDWFGRPAISPLDL